MPRQGLGHSSVDIYNMVTPGTDDPVWRNKTSGQLMVGYQQTRSNFVLFSQDATDAEAWTKQNTAISTTLYEAPDNSTTANAIKSNTTGSKNYYLQQQSLSVTAGKTYTASVHLKKGTLGFGWLRAGDGTTDYSAAFNLNTGAVTNTSQVLSTSVDAMDDDWFRCSVTFQAQNTSSNGNVIVFAQIDATDNTPNVAVSGVELLYVWGWQLEENSEPSAYIVTTNAARTTTETLNDTSETWDFDSADLMPEADPDDDGVWEIPDNIVLNGDYEELGSELVTNGDFTNGTNGWSAAGIATINIVNGELEVNVTGGGGGFLRTSNIPCVDGRTYLVSIDYRAGTYVGDVSPIIDGVAQDLITPTSVTQTETWKIVANGSSFQLSFVRSAAYTGTIYYDNVSVKQVDPNDRWVSEADWTIEDGVAKGNGASGSSEELRQDGILTVGDTYEFTFTIKDYSSGSVELINNGLGSLSSNGVHTGIGVATSTDLRFRGSSFNGSIDNVTATEYAIQPQDV